MAFAVNLASISRSIADSCNNNCLLCYSSGYVKTCTAARQPIAAAKTTRREYSYRGADSFAAVAFISTAETILHHGSSRAKVGRRRVLMAAGGDGGGSPVQPPSAAPKGASKTTTPRQRRKEQNDRLSRVFAQKIKKMPDAAWKGVLTELEMAEERSSRTKTDAAGGGGGGGGAVGVLAGAPVTNRMYCSCIAHMARNKRWKEALGILRRMREKGVVPTSATYNAAITACGNAGQGGQALEVLQEMRNADDVQPDVVSYTAAISACGTEWRTALELLAEMRGKGVAPNSFTFNAVMTACDRGGQWRMALALFEKMRAAGVAPDVISYAAAIQACGRGGQARRALDFLDEMRHAGMVPNVIVYNSAITACANKGLWEKALELLGDMRVLKLVPTAASYSGAITASCNGGQPRKAMELLDEMGRAGVRSDVFTYSGAIIACDLEGKWKVCTRRSFSSFLFSLFFLAISSKGVICLHGNLTTERSNITLRVLLWCIGGCVAFIISRHK